MKWWKKTSPKWNDSFRIDSPSCNILLWTFILPFLLCRLINKNVLKWFLLIMCKADTLRKSRNLLTRNHLSLFLIKKKMSADAQYFLTVWLEVTHENPTTSSGKLFSPLMALLKPCVRKKQSSNIYPKCMTFLHCNLANQILH